MPTYTYQVINEDGTEGEIFEWIHRMSDPALTTHPETGEPVVRVFSAPHVAGYGNERLGKQMTSDKNLEKLGFTKYVRNGKGHYEKRVGKDGPDRLQAD